MGRETSGLVSTEGVRKCADAYVAAWEKRKHARIEFAIADAMAENQRWFWERWLGHPPRYRTREQAIAWLKQRDADEIYSKWFFLKIEGAYYAKHAKQIRQLAYACVSPTMYLSKNDIWILDAEEAEERNKDDTTKLDWE